MARAFVRGFNKCLILETDVQGKTKKRLQPKNGGAISLERVQVQRPINDNPMVWRGFRSPFNVFWTDIALNRKMPPMSDPILDGIVSAPLHSNHDQIPGTLVEFHSLLLGRTSHLLLVIRTQNLHPTRNRFQQPVMFSHEFLKIRFALITVRREAV